MSHRFNLVTASPPQCLGSHTTAPACHLLPLSSWSTGPGEAARIVHGMGSRLPIRNQGTSSKTFDIFGSACLVIAYLHLALSHYWTLVMNTISVFPGPAAVVWTFSSNISVLATSCDQFAGLGRVFLQTQLWIHYERQSSIFQHVDGWTFNQRGFPGKKNRSSEALTNNHTMLGSELVEDYPAALIFDGEHPGNT